LAKGLSELSVEHPAIMASIPIPTSFWVIRIVFNLVL
jgi:hypothetical protein